MHLEVAPFIQSSISLAAFFTAVQPDGQKLTNDSTEACQKVLAQSRSLHERLSRQCNRRGASRPALLQTVNRTIELSALLQQSAQEHYMRAAFLSGHLGREADWPAGLARCLCACDRLDVCAVTSSQRRL